MQSFLDARAYSAALEFFRRVNPSLDTPKHHALIVKTLLHNELWAEAYSYSRHVASKVEYDLRKTNVDLAVSASTELRHVLIQEMVTWFASVQHVDDLLQLAWTEAEEQVLLLLLREHGERDLEGPWFDFIVGFYLLRGRVAEAYETHRLHESLLASSALLSSVSAQPAFRARQALMQNYMSSFSSTQAEFIKSIPPGFVALHPKQTIPSHHVRTPHKPATLSSLKLADVQKSLHGTTPAYTPGPERKRIPYTPGTFSKTPNFARKNTLAKEKEFSIAQTIFSSPTPDRVQLKLFADHHNVNENSTQYEESKSDSQIADAALLATPKLPPQALFSPSHTPQPTVSTRGPAASKGRPFSRFGLTPSPSRAMREFYFHRNNNKYNF